jgi:DNA-directed RNA polymerase subunit K/omega
MGFENLDVELLSGKTGGRTKSTALLQKRIRELERGWPPLVVAERMDIIQTAIREFREDKIWLVSGEEAEALREQRMVEERDRARALEAARRAAEIEAGPAPSPPRTGLSGALGLRP